MAVKNKETGKKKTSKISGLISENNIVSGSFIVEGRLLKVVAFADDGKKIEQTIELEKSSVSLSLT